VHESLELSPINRYLVEIGETPIAKQKLNQQKYPKQKMSKICTTIKRTVWKGTGNYDDSEIIQQLKDEFHSTAQKSKKFKILTILPKSWSTKQIETEFGVSNYMA